MFSRMKFLIVFHGETFLTGFLFFQGLMLTVVSYCVPGGMREAASAASTEGGVRFVFRGRMVVFLACGRRYFRLT